MTYAERMKWFNEARFGMFIHYGLYSLMGRGEWAMFMERIPAWEYAPLADQFRPQRGCVEQWVDLARRAGMRYAVLTTRHHDGFCLYDSHVSDFTSVRTAAQRDLVAEYVEACRRANLKVGLYYSLLDWRFPGYHDRAAHPDSAREMVDQAHAQVKELLTQYGRIDLLWFDGGWLPGPAFAVDAGFWRAQELLDTIRRLQPHIILNDRTGLKGDCDSPEQQVVASEAGRSWEACMTIGDNCAWGYVQHCPNLKSTTQLIQHLVTAASNGGNYLLNIGPRPDGAVQPEFVERLEQIGAWMNLHGESIRGSERLPAGWGKVNWDWWWPAHGGMIGTCTARGARVYLHVFRWPGRTACIAGIGSRVRAARVMATGQPARVAQTDDGRLFIEGLPDAPPDPHDSVLALELDGPPRAFLYEGLTL